MMAARDASSRRVSAPPTEPGEITRLLDAFGAGDGDAFDKLVPLVYDQLLILARQQLARWRRGGTLDTTSLAHEAYLRLCEGELADLADRQHFYAVVSRSMRFILVDRARARQAAKRGAGQSRVTLDRVEVASPDEFETMLSIDQALSHLAEVDQRLERVFECRFFGGLTASETAGALGLSERTVHRDWLKAKGFLRSRLG